MSHKQFNFLVKLIFATLLTANDHIEFLPRTFPNKIGAVNAPPGADKTPFRSDDVAIICIESTLFEVYYRVAVNRELLYLPSKDNLFLEGWDFVFTCS